MNEQIFGAKKLIEICKGKKVAFLENSPFLHSSCEILANFLKNHGIDVAVALRKGQDFSEYDLPEKWKNMSDEDIKSIDGVIKSRDYREGSVTVMLF